MEKLLEEVQQLEETAKLETITDQLAKLISYNMTNSGATVTRVNDRTNELEFTVGLSMFKVRITEL